MAVGKINFCGNLSYNKPNFKAKNDIEHFEGCLFGGAVGDAFGRIVENTPIEIIKEKFGSNGIRYIPKSNGKYKITDDTQMTLFTAEGLIKSFLQKGDLNKEPNYDDIYKSYMRWYDTQTIPFSKVKEKTGLMEEKDLYEQRGPGITCLTALKEGIPGSLDKKINDSAGNGGIMRVAPVGLMYHNNPELSFEVGSKTAALTHSNPSGYLPSGFQAALIANIINDKELTKAIVDTKEILKKYKDNQETIDSIEIAEKLAKKENISPIEAISQIGKGGKGNEALGIALYCALKNPNNFKKAIAMAANHSGDSDTTAAITGNILGAYNGLKSINRGFVNNIELFDWLCRMANNLLITDKDIEVTKKYIDGAHNLLEETSDDKFSIQ